MTDTPHIQVSQAPHGSKAWREAQAELFLGAGWFEMNTTLGRTLAIALRTLARLTPRELEALPMDHGFRVELDDDRGAVLLKRLTPTQCRTFELPYDDALAILAPNADGSSPEEGEHMMRALCVPTTMHAMLHATPDPYYAAEQCVTALAALGLLAHRDGRMTPERDRLFYEVEDAPKRMMLAARRDYRSSSMRERWVRIREMLTMLYWRGVPLLSEHDESPGRTISARDFGPFAHGAVKAWRLSRHVFEDAKTVDHTLAAHAKNLADWEELSPTSKHKKRGRKPVHPDHVKACSSRGAIRIDPAIFSGSATHVCGQLAGHVHRGLNAGQRAGLDLQLELWETLSGQAIRRSNRRRRLSRRRASAVRCFERAISAGTFARRTDSNDVPIPVARPRGRTVLLAFAPVSPAG